MFPPTPTPPATVSAPVSVVVEGVNSGILTVALVATSIGVLVNGSTPKGDVACDR